VVSLHRSAESMTGTSAKVLADAGAAEAAGAVVFDGELQPVAADTSTGVEPPPEFAAWLAAVQSARDASSQPAAISASGLEGTDPAVVLDPQVVEIAGRAKGKRSLEEPPWSKGRYGTAVGRAVHGVLQVVDLATGEGLEEAVAAQCVAEGVVEYAGVVGGLVQSALESEVVQRAAARDHWRESYVGMVQDDGSILEGFVDLIYREDDGSLVIVDYKTDAVPDSAIPVRTAYYRPQMEAYESIVSRAAAGKPRSQLLFLQPR